MFLYELELKQFRCFEKKKVEFKKSLTLITGDNGTGKTSLAEAIHYLCYVKSFRTSNPLDLVYKNSDTFFLKGSFSPVDKMLESQTIQIGYAHKKKAIKIDGKAVTTHKDIFQVFQVVTLLEDDINLITGYPSGRRSFIDQATTFLHPKYLDVYRNFKKILQSRNALLMYHTIDNLELEIWTQKLWQASIEIQKYRRNVLQQIEKVVNSLLNKYFDSVYDISIGYESKHVNLEESFEQFLKRSLYLLRQERMYKRSSFGAHLDDIIIKMKNQNAKIYASRGQQKLISLLCKLSLISLAEQNKFLPIIIIDDFIADFDKKRLQNIINFLLKCENQVIITTPFYDSDLKKIVEKADPDVISMNL